MNNSRFTRVVNGQTEYSEDNVNWHRGMDIDEFISALPNHPASSCCHAPLNVVNGREGTSYYNCTKCLKPADMYVPDTVISDENKENTVTSAQPTEANLERSITLLFAKHSEDKNISKLVAEIVDFIGQRDREWLTGSPRPTGLKDKNGKYIYAGDVVKFDDSAGHVWWQPDAARFVIDWRQDDLSIVGLKHHLQLEVIGNIRDGDLLK